MNLYISGISGTGMGPLALMAHAAGYQVFGSDLQEGPVTAELRAEGIDFYIGTQDGAFFKQIHTQHPIDWFIYTSALPEDHAELQLAKQLKIKSTKRDQLISHLVKELNLKMIAVAGTHGKTTTTSMLIWAAQQLNLPAAYLVGTTLPFAPAGRYHPGDQFFIYEADEYDRNFLHFHPWLALIPSISYDHPDIYPTPEDYNQAFDQFRSQCETVITLEGVTHPASSVHESSSEKSETLHFHPDNFNLAGPARRLDAALAAEAILRTQSSNLTPSKLIDIFNRFPGTGRRFERLAPGVYTDYAHHPEEISATIEIAREEAARQHLKGVVAIYQPHQNTRQHQVRSGYRDAFLTADSVSDSFPTTRLAIDRLYWLPTYLTREDSKLSVITSEEFIQDLERAASANLSRSAISRTATHSSTKAPTLPVYAAQNLSEIADQIKDYHSRGYLILLMAAGPADTEFRQLFAE